MSNQMLAVLNQNILKVLIEILSLPLGTVEMQVLHTDVHGILDSRSGVRRMLWKSLFYIELGDEVDPLSIDPADVLGNGWIEGRPSTYHHFFLG